MHGPPLQRRALLLGAIALAADGWADLPRAEPQPPDLAALEPLYAVSAAPQGLTIRVASKGCTAKADFAFYVDRKPGGAAAIAFGRNSLDICKAAKPGGHVDLVFSYAELGLSADTPLAILNSLAPQPATPGTVRHAQRPSVARNANRRRARPSSAPPPTPPRSDRRSG